MDQFISLFGKAGHLVRLDTKTMEYEYFPFDPKGYKLVLLDTLVKHELASSAYNDRRHSCENAAATIAKRHPEAKFRRDARSRRSSIALLVRRREFRASIRSMDIRQPGPSRSRRNISYLAYQRGAQVTRNLLLHSDFIENVMTASEKELQKGSTGGTQDRRVLLESRLAESTREYFRRILGKRRIFFG